MFRKQSTNIVLIGIILAVASSGLIFISARNANEGWRNIRDDVVLQLMPATHKENIDVLHRPFISEVDVGVVIDAGTKYQFVNSVMLEEWNIDEDTLYAQASNNLDAISRNIKVEVAQASEEDETAKYVIVELDDGYAAARLLSDGVRKAITRELGESYIAAIPTRDFLIFWHKDFSLFDAFASQVQNEFDQEEDYPLTPTLLFVDSSGIQEMINNEL
ncbi:MAG: DUF1444 family protein [Candidatus Peribacter sp.]|nr:DUF1444 family protein [Candidatus Peribacter sp.]MBT4393133.1 DUF1444 family protein [Candidatus Peribacter sp.]MBT4600932.1 DUF1444 family protein [Candidatus Peribacter sp.]MBT5148938.1 DUF1444 family protein [Candidatus Peribacter sp.]MBT5638383.1 DUF1444 family protein [Candidatus Peribacter sp.]